MNNGRLFSQQSGPYAGNLNVDIIPGTKKRWLIHGLWITVICDATVASRYVQIHEHYDLVLGAIGHRFYSAALTAGQTGEYEIGKLTLPTGWTCDRVHMDIQQPIIVDGNIGVALRINSVNGVAGDSITVRYLAEEFVS